MRARAGVVLWSPTSANCWQSHSTRSPLRRLLAQARLWGTLASFVSPGRPSVAQEGTVSLADSVERGSRSTPVAGKKMLKTVPVWPRARLRTPTEP